MTSHLPRSSLVALLASLLCGLPPSTRASSLRGQPIGFASNQRQDTAQWQDFAPEGEEFSVSMPRPPSVSRGTRYAYLDRDVLVSFRIYRVVYQHTLFIIQSYELPTPKAMLKGLFSGRRNLKLGQNLEQSGYKGKTFSQTDDRFSSKGQYFVTANHIYVVEAANRGEANPGIDQFLTSFNLHGADRRTVSQAASLAESGPAPITDLYSSRDVSSKVIILAKQEPGYSPAARDNHLTGTVMLKVTLASSGNIADIEVASGLKGLTQLAIEASKTMIFIPAEKDGKPVSQRVLVEYSFMLSP